MRPTTVLSNSIYPAITFKMPCTYPSHFKKLLLQPSLPFCSPTQARSSTILRSFASTHVLGTAVQKSKPKTYRSSAARAYEGSNRGSFTAKKTAQEIIDANGQIPISITDPSGWCGTELLKMGAYNFVIKNHVTAVLLHGLTCRYTPLKQVQIWRRYGFVKDEISDAASARIFYIIGVTLLRETERVWFDVGTHALESAAELGSTRAAMLVCAIENENSNRPNSFQYQASPQAKRLVSYLAGERTSWEAMSIQLAQLKAIASRPTKLNEGFELAKALVEVTEADTSRKENGPDFVRCEPPWRHLRDFAKLKGDAATEISAVKLGALEYNDPEAAEQLAESGEVEIYSRQWLELVTKAAMSGSSAACWSLGKYWLEKKGWYPSNGKVSINGESFIGFDWLELAAASREPLDAARVCLSMALVCRENNHSEVGLRYLEGGVATIDSGDGDAERKATAVNRLQRMISDWSYDKVFEQTTAKAEFYLKKPRLH